MPGGVLEVIFFDCLLGVEVPVTKRVCFHKNENYGYKRTEGTLRIVLGEGDKEQEDFHQLTSGLHNPFMLRLCDANAIAFEKCSPARLRKGTFTQLFTGTISKSSQSLLAWSTINFLFFVCLFLFICLIYFLKP